MPLNIQAKVLARLGLVNSPTSVASLKLVCDKLQMKPVPSLTAGERAILIAYEEVQKATEIFKKNS